MPHEPCRVVAGTVTIDRARFSFLTNHIVRMEYDSSGQFVDEPTLAVQSRCGCEVALTVEHDACGFVVRTSQLTLSYKPDGTPFSPDNLAVSFLREGRRVVWVPGMRDEANLKGTCRTLDNTEGDSRISWEPDPKDGGAQSVSKKAHEIELCDGFVSRSGWSLYDDSGSPILTHDSRYPGGWIAPRRPSHVFDLYFMAFGHDYKTALREASTVFGRQPLPPRYTLGYWYSKYWAYTDREILELVRACERFDLPLDVIVVDMDWHQLGWTGYTWDPDYFPDPAAFLAELRDRGIKVTLNLHPAAGIGVEEEAYPAMAEAVGKSPGDLQRIPFDATDPAFIQAYFKWLHHPKEDLGVDFWWMDWQQGEKTSVEKLDPLTWLNHLHWEDRARRRKGSRPLIFSRYGGVGAGRYPIGFSGDTTSTWGTLGYQSYFTATAANVLYGTWSHDIGGHAPGKVDPELYTRWVQFGVFSPILRTHTTKNPDAVRLPWLFPAPYSELVMHAIRRRYEIVPYIYTENRAAFDTGLSLVRPMYYEWPEEEAAYEARNQYQFGSQMIVAPIATPVDPHTLEAEVTLWLPHGNWIDTSRGELVNGGQMLTRRYLLSEVPVFVRPGTIVVGQKVAHRLEPGSYRDLVITVYPGESGSYTLYEDDGVSNDYVSGVCAWIPIQVQSNGDETRVLVGPAEGSFRGFEKQRSLTLRLAMTAPPRSVLSGSESVAWHYDGTHIETVIDIDSFDVTRGLAIDLGWDGAISHQELSGLSGLLARLDAVRTLVSAASTAHPIHPEERLVVKAAQTGRRIELAPHTAKSEMESLRSVLARLPDTLSEHIAAHRKSREFDPEREKLLVRAQGLLAATLAQFHRSAAPIPHVIELPIEAPII